MKLTLFVTFPFFFCHIPPITAKIQTYLKNFTSTFDKEFIEVPYSLEPSRNHNDINYHLNISIIAKKKLNTVFLDYQLLIHPYGSPNISVPFAKQMINFCKTLKKRNGGDRMTNFMLSQMKKFGRLPRSCPITPVRISYLLICFKSYLFIY